MKTDPPFGEAQAVKFQDENVRLDRSIQVALESSRLASSDAKAWAGLGGAGRTCPMPVDLLVDLCETLGETLWSSSFLARRPRRAVPSASAPLPAGGPPGAPDRRPITVNNVDGDSSVERPRGNARQKALRALRAEAAKGNTANDLFLRIVELALKTPHDDLTAPLRALREDMQARGVHLDDAP